VTWWLWVIAGAGVFIALSIVVALAVAAVLGQIGSDVSQLFETEVWTDAPLRREEGEIDEDRADEVLHPRPERAGATRWRHHPRVKS
jgi:hypothetical protein